MINPFISTGVGKPVKNKLRLNNQDYEIVLTLFNPQGILFPINTASLVSFTIEETTLNWYKKATLILKNSENILERRPNELFSKNFNYKFRNDGRDLLLVNIKPISDKGTVYEEQFPSELYELNYVFSIYDTEDLPGRSLSEKNIKFYLWEYDYQLFLETNLDWSTNKVLYELYPELNGKSSILPDNQRVVPTGLALRSLIEETLNSRSATQTFDIWDPGASKIFYSSPAANSAIYDFDYLFKRHVSSKKYGDIDGDLSIIFRSRFEKRWNLLSFSGLFSYAINDSKLAGPLQKEQFIITNTIPTDVVIPSLKHTPQDTTGKLNINFGVINNIVNYRFVNMAAIDNTMLLKSTPCYHYSYKTGQFGADFVDNDIEIIKNYYQNEYVNKFELNTKPKALFTLNKSKIQNQTFNAVYSYEDTKINRFADSRNLVLHSSLFLNECLSFTVLGSTYRQANVFIGLDRESGAVDADFDEKLLGQWFTIKVDHVFTQTGYMNNIVAIKPHSDRDIRVFDENVV
jgi:hypothetical protein